MSAAMLRSSAGHGGHVAQLAPGLPSLEAAVLQLLHYDLCSSFSSSGHLCGQASCLWSVYLLSVASLFALQATPGHVWLCLDAGGRTVDIAMHRIDEGATPDHFQM
jgi:hypothetical protein